jgi:hypothetical protein
LPWRSPSAELPARQTWQPAPAPRAVRSLRVVASLDDGGGGVVLGVEGAPRCWVLACLKTCLCGDVSRARLLSCCHVEPVVPEAVHVLIRLQPTLARRLYRGVGLGPNCRLRPSLAMPTPVS